MPIPNSKKELILAITESYQKLKDEINDISPELADKKSIEGHKKNTLISLNNLLAYIVGWGQLVLKWNKNKNIHLSVDFPETGYKWNELGLLAQKFYQDYEKESLTSLKSKLEKTTREILKLIESKSNTELYESLWYKQWTLGRMIQLNTSSPFKNAVTRIRKWKKNQITIKHLS